MEPTHRYLCIVPASGGGVDVRQPFEGNNMLSIILSKAPMLPADDEITDPGYQASSNGERGSLP